MLLRRNSGVFLLAAAISVVGNAPLFGQQFERLPEVGTFDQADLRDEAGLAGHMPLGGLSLAATSPTGEIAHYTDGEFPTLLRLDDLPDAENRRFVWDDIWLDHQNFYSTRTLRQTLPVLGMAAALANTPADREVRDWWQARVHNPELADFWNSTKQFGEGKWMIPASGVAWLTGEWLSTEDSTHWLGQWGGRTSRAYLVGFPVLLSSQWIVGGSRPDEGELASHWGFGQDDNGVSGHAFMGAMPFLTAAQLCESPWAKALCYAGSALTPLSRIEHDRHFASQVILGWWLAYMAASAVDETFRSYGPWQIEPMPIGDGVGVFLTWNR